MQLNANIKKLEHHFLPKDFKITNWEIIEPYFKQLARPQYRLKK